jgi:CheY-like chemotaxis protein
VLFPSTENEPSQAPQPGAAVQVPAGGGTVLVVDDDPSVRQVASQMLEMAGYEVLLAGDGGEAVACFAARPEAIDLVLLDMTMPNMDGSEAFQELRKLRPDVRVILSSGYNEQDATNRFAGKGLAGFIQKPYRAAKLLAAVGEALGGQRAGRSGTGPEREQEER